MYKRSIRGWAKHWDFVLIDALCLQLSYVLAYWIRYHSFDAYKVVNGITTYRTAGIVLFFSGIIITIFFNTMHNVLRRSPWEELKYTIVQCVLVLAAIALLLFTDKSSNHISRIIIYTTIGLYLVLSFLTRLLYKRILLNHRRSAPKRGMLLIGDKVGIEKALEAFSNHPEEGIDVRGLVLLDGEEEINGISVVADKDRATEYIRNNWIDEVYVAVEDFSLLPTIIIEQCSEMAVTVHQQMFKNANVRGEQFVEKIAKQPVLTTSIRIPKPRSLIIKRVIDIFAGFFLSFAALLLLLFVIPIIKIKSPGPVLLKHERVGLNGRKFAMWTIRTMNIEKGEIIRGIGEILRKTRLEDLPKGFSVLLGTMSLVGVRAPSVEEWEQYELRHRARLSCKPGITGLWQASGRAKEMSFEEATQLDTEYITNWSLGLDFQILMRTARL